MSRERRGDAATMPAVPQVHLVRPADVPAAAASLVRAFHDDPMLTYMFPDRGRGNEPCSVSSSSSSARRT